MKLAVTIGKIRLQITLLQTETAKALMAALPFESRAQTWGEEVYFSTPVSASLEKDARQVVEPGTARFWTECNVLGRLEDSRELSAVRSGDLVRVEAA